MSYIVETFIVYDRDTHGIICQTESMFLARSLITGMSNGDSTLLFGKWGMWNTLVHDPAINRKFDFNNIDVHYQLLGLEGVVVPLTENLITPEWVKKRRILMLKLEWIKNLENLVRSMTIKTSEYFGSSNFEGFLSTQLNKCDPSTNTYTSAIKDWAAIQDIPESAAFQELTIRSEHYGLTHMRNHAIYLKYVRKINQSNSAEECFQWCKLAWDELLRNASV